MKKIVFILCSVLLSTSSFANSEQNSSLTAGENGCRFFEVEIANSSKNSCVITNEYFVGNPVGAVPSSYTVSPGAKVTFLGRESAFGVSMSIKAQCGADNSIHFHAYQGHCGGLWAERIGVHMHHRQNMRAFGSSELGSSLASRPGKLMMILTTMD